MLTADDLERAQRLVRREMTATPQYRWPLLEEAVGGELWVKHENHTPTGAFKVRGGIVYVARFHDAEPDAKGLITATRGNHGQSLARAAVRAGLRCTVVVPTTNSPEKNAAMRAFGAEVVEYGIDFDVARVHAAELAARDGLSMTPNYHPWIVAGVATYAAELFEAAGELDAIYVPIGMGSGICALMAVRDLLGYRTEIIGVVAEGAPAYARSFEAGRVVTTPEAHTFADGMACREPNEEALNAILQGAARVVVLDDDQIAAAIRLHHTASHNLAEGAGAAALAARLKERERMAGTRTAVILCGGNIDMAVARAVLAGETPAPF